MTDQKSYTRIEGEILPAYRRNIAAAETGEDVRKQFARTVCELLAKASDDKVRCRHEDVALLPAATPPYSLAEAITGQPAYQLLAKNSDLAPILARLAEPAVNRHVHLAKHPEKTNSKLYHNQ